MKHAPPIVMTVAGSDSGGGAGVQADLKTFTVQGCFGVTVITALTAQNSMGVKAVHAVPSSFVRNQLEAVLEDMNPRFAKTGMLPTADIVRTVAGALKASGLDGLVVDPVMISTTGHTLIDEEAALALVEHLFPLASLVTPNLHETAALVGGEVTKEDDLEKAARRIYEMGPGAVLVKGGHLQGTATDCFYDGAKAVLLRGERVRTSHTHGSGCVLSAAIAALLARGKSLEHAVREAKAFITAAVRGAFPVGAGPGPVNPVAGRSL